MAQMVKNAYSAGDLGLIPGLGRSLGGEMATHSSILSWRIPMDRGAWQAHRVAGSDMTEQLSTTQGLRTTAPVL